MSKTLEEATTEELIEELTKRIPVKHPLLEQYKEPPSIHDVTVMFNAIWDSY